MRGDGNGTESNSGRLASTGCPDNQRGRAVALASSLSTVGHEAARQPLSPTEDGSRHCYPESIRAPRAGTRETAGLWPLIAAPRFAELLSLMADHGVLRKDFNEFEMPEGFGADEVWGVLTTIRRPQAIHYYDVVYTHSHAVDSWFTPTHRLMKTLRDLELSTCAGSRLDAALAERHGRRFIVRTLIEEAVAALECDGLDVDYETARALIAAEQEPASPVERLVVNTHGLLSRIIDEDFARITPELVQSMYEELTAGIDTSKLGTYIPWGDEWPDDPIPRDEALRQICAMAAGELVDPAEHPIVLSQRLICKFWKTAPYPCCNYILGSLLSRLHMKQTGYPAFAYVPSSSITLAWKHGNFTCEGVAAYHESGNVTEFERDWTVYWESCTRLLLTEVHKLEELIFRLKAQDDALLTHLANDHAFNHRQREVLRRAILVPGTAVRIDEHKKRYDLAYSTARQDLTTLVERGMLDMHYEGKAQVFASRREMKSILTKRYGCDGSANR